MNAKAIKEQYPEGYQEIFELGMQSVDVDAIRAGAAADGGDQERARVLAILKADGDPVVTRQAIEDGRPVEQAYGDFFLAEKSRRETALQQYSTEGPESAGHGAKPKEQPSGGDFMALVDNHQAEKKCSRTEALSAIASRHPALHQAWLDMQKASA